MYETMSSMRQTIILRGIKISGDSESPIKRYRTLNVKDHHQIKQTDSFIDATTNNVNDDESTANKTITNTINTLTCTDNLSHFLAITNSATSSQRVSFARPK